MSGLCTIEEVELYLLELYSDDPSAGPIVKKDQVQLIIDGVSSEIRNITNRNLTATDYDSTFDMDGSEVTLEDYPLQSVTTVSYGSPFGGTSRTELDSDSYITYDNIGVIKLQFNLRRAEQWVRVVYRAGYEEGDTYLDYINLVCIKAVVEELNNVDIDSNLKNEKLGDASWSYKNTSEKKDALKKQLSGYIRLGI